MSNTIDLNALTKLSNVFKDLSNGKHINRVEDPSVWVELEEAREEYCSLFESLGFDLRIDGRGFAWFHNDEISSKIRKTSQQFALLFMVIFDAQADAGKPLMRFEEWPINRDLLKAAYELHQDVLQAENLSVDDLFNLLERAARLGFARNEHGTWYLLPAVCRYLDHFEALFQESSTRLTIYQTTTEDKLHGGDEA